MVELAHRDPFTEFVEIQHPVAVGVVKLQMELSTTAKRRAPGKTTMVEMFNRKNLGFSNGSKVLPSTDAAFAILFVFHLCFYNSETATGVFTRRV